MLRILLILTLSFGLFLPRASAAVQVVDFSELIHEAGSLARQGEWDRSEAVFMKAAESPIPDDRLRAYEGLSELYKRLKLFKKAGRAETKLKAEKAFIEKLVPQDEKYYKTYKLQWGDTYAKIAKREGVSLEWLRRANDKKPLIEGRTIKVPKKSYRLVVSKKNKTLKWMRGKEVLKTYAVAVGRKGMETPGGKFKIESKVKEPTWYWLKSEIPPGSPKNLLGTRWMGLNHKGYGLHGTRDPHSIGAAASHGCVRLLNRDVEELFEWISVGTEVTIE
jgi:lipoprotein-anchoring transpeptidase ErfK/SrfK